MMHNDKTNTTEMSRSVYDSLYQRNPNSYTGKQTVIVNDYRNSNDVNQEMPVSRYEDQQYSMQSFTPEPPTKRMIAGALYSVSRSRGGEIFPVYIGENRVGCDKNCDICLLEGTVSAIHAVLNVQRSNNWDSEYEITLTDSDSHCGTLVGNTVVGYSTVQVKDGDILTIGRHYKLLVKLFEPSRYSLSPDAGFVPASNIANEEEGTVEQMSLDTINADFYQRNDMGASKQTVLYDKSPIYR